MNSLCVKERVTENTQELTHDGLALESCLLVNCFHGFSLDVTRHSSHASLLTLHARCGREDGDETLYICTSRLIWGPVR
jgi:hypothetical protein